MNPNVNMWYAGRLIFNLVVVATHKLRTAAVDFDGVLPQGLLVGTESFASISFMSLVLGCGSVLWPLAVNISHKATEKKGPVEK